MTMYEVMDFLTKNGFYHKDDVDGMTVKSIEARVYPPNNDFLISFFSWQSDDDRRQEVDTIIKTHRRRGRELIK